MRAGDLDVVRALLDLAPQVKQEAQVGAELVFRCAFGGGADDESAGGFAALVDENALEALALLVRGDFAADADVGDGGHEDQEAAGEGDVRSDARALLGDGFLGDLDQNLLAGLEQVADDGQIGGLHGAARGTAAIALCAGSRRMRHGHGDRVRHGRGAAWIARRRRAGLRRTVSSSSSSSPSLLSKFNWMRWSR